MKATKVFFAIALIMMCVACVELPVLSMDTGFSTGIMEADRSDRFIENINVSFLKEEPSKWMIDCFDVREDGWIVLGLEGWERKTVVVYTNDGVFQYGYQFDCSGSYGVEWDGENVLVYFVRSDIAVSLAPSGEVTEIAEIQDTDTQYWRDVVFAKKRVVGDAEYQLKNDMGIFNLFATTWSRLIVTDPSGETAVFYDANDIHWMKMIGLTVLVGSFVILLAIMMIREFKKALKAKNQPAVSFGDDEALEKRWWYRFWRSRWKRR